MEMLLAEWRRAFSAFNEVLAVQEAAHDPDVRMGMEPAATAAYDRFVEIGERIIAAPANSLAAIQAQLTIALHFATVEAEPDGLDENWKIVVSVLRGIEAMQAA